MAKGTLKEKDIAAHLHGEGFKEIRAEDKKAEWYKKASEKPFCLKESAKKKVKN